MLKAFLFVLFVFNSFVLAQDFDIVLEQKIPNFDKKQNYSKKENYVKWTPYMQEVSERIRRNWHPPKYKKSASVVVKLTIAKNGQLLDYKIIKSSNEYSIDKSVLDAVEKTAPFKPLPEKYSKNSVSSEFTFDYNIPNIHRVD